VQAASFFSRRPGRHACMKETTGPVLVKFKDH
jgi:hypothetical protein